MPEQPTQRRIRPAAPQKTVVQPWTPHECDPEDVGALRAVYHGTAAEHQQRRAMDFIVKRLCGVGEFTYIPGGEDGRRATDFKAGKQHVGLEILSLVAVKVKPGGEQP